MNVIVTNKYRDMLVNTKIEIIKEVSGVFTVSELANSLNSFFYKKIIIDATALANFPKEEVLRNLANSFDTSKLILFLPPDNPPPKKFLSFLTDLKIYNFTDNIYGLLSLLDQNNTYEDVSSYINNNSNNKTENVNTSLDFSSNLSQVETDKIILGIKNVTDNAGSTSLIYMLKKCLKEIHKKDVAAIEVLKNNLMYYNDSNVYSLTPDKLLQFISSNNYDIILLDLDNNVNSNLCHDVLYLVEPSLYRINQAMMNNRNVFNDLKGKKVILYNSMLSEKDLSIFSREAGINIYFNLPPLNDRVHNPILTDLLAKLGLITLNGDNTHKGLLDLFK